MSNCLYCGESLKEVISTHKEYEDGLNITILNTPIDRCDDCEDEYFSAKTMYIINDIINDVIKEKKSVEDSITVDFNKYSQ